MIPNAWGDCINPAFQDLVGGLVGRPQGSCGEKEKKRKKKKIFFNLKPNNNPVLRENARHLVGLFKPPVEQSVNLIPQEQA